MPSEGETMQNYVSLCIYLGVLLFSAFLLNKKYEHVQLATFLGMLIPIVFAAGRYKVGTDFWTYERIFQRVARESFGDFLKRLLLENDQLFTIICRYAYKLGGRVLTWGILAALIFIPIVRTCRKYYPDMSQGTAIAVFLLSAFVSSFNICREYVAVTFVFCSVSFVHENKLRRFLLMILLAILFHDTAFIALVLWFLWDHKKNGVISITKQIIFVLGTLVMALFYRQAIQLAARFIPQLRSYAEYYSSEIESGNRDFYVSVLVLIIVFCLIRHVRAVDKRADYFFILLIVGTLIGFTGFTHPQFKRIALYFSVPANIYFAGYMPRCFKKGQEVIASVLITGFYVALFILTFFILGQARLFPYVFNLTSSVF